MNTLEEPLEALAKEQKGYPKLKEIAEKISQLIKKEKIKLKPEKAKKAEQSTEEIVKRNSWTKIHGKIVHVTTTRNSLMTSER